MVKLMQQPNQSNNLLRSLLTAFVVMIFGVLHFTVFTTMPTHAAHSSGTQNHISDAATACSQQCPALNTQQQQADSQNEDDKEPATPFATLLGLIGFSFSLYLLPSTLKQVRRIIKIPIYKQVACYRI